MSDGHPYEQMEFGCIEGNEGPGTLHTADKGGKGSARKVNRQRIAVVWPIVWVAQTGAAD